MENANVVKSVTAAVVGFVSGIGAYLSGKLGVLFYVLVILGVMMGVDYITGMLASKKEAIEHPDDTGYGWSSKKGTIGIIKKVGYLCVIAVAVAFDYIILYALADTGIEIDIKAFFGILVTVWFVLNEMLSIAENAGRMGAPIPAWLTKYIAVLKNKIEAKGETKEGDA